VSGKVKRPGLWELPMGTPLREMLEEHAGGMRDGLSFKGLLPGGASTDFLVEEHLDVPMDFGSVSGRPAAAWARAP
jgi:NADH-quinone oxidoreductase subunit F